uniref:Uncharacterized protein n=1 Tax=Cacopsylla melanoneura TaxID=428564 RepID=A0A8D9B509_9HEMI
MALFLVTEYEMSHCAVGENSTRSCASFFYRIRAFSLQNMCGSPIFIHELLKDELSWVDSCYRPHHRNDNIQIMPQLLAKHFLPFVQLNESRFCLHLSCTFQSFLCKR